MSMSDPLNQASSILCHSEPSDVSYSPNQFLVWDFFAVSYSKTALTDFLINTNIFSLKQILKSRFTEKATKFDLIVTPRFSVYN